VIAKAPSTEAAVEEAQAARTRSWWAQLRRRPELVVGLVIVVLALAVSVFGGLIMPYPPDQANFAITLAPPGPGHLLGTDNLGRDVLSRLIAGTGSSLLSAVGAVAIAVAAGTIVGVAAARASGSIWDDVLMRIMDAILALPPLVLAIAVAFVLGSGLTNAMIAIAVVFTPGFARLARSKALQVLRLGYVEAAFSVGASTPRVLARHVVPNIIGPSIAAGVLNVGSAVIVEASLSFLGLGLAPPAPTWGFMISSGVTYLEQAPWLVLAPSAAIALSVFGFTLLGRGLNDWT
jgi:ABC-type dipeptide/oligopeptide/nickel transport system permease subunit